MAYRIPSAETKQLRQLNAGDLSGELFVTKNVSLDDEGYISLAQPMVAFYDTADDADFDQCDTTFATTNGVWAVSDDLFLASDIGGPNQTVTNRSGDTGAPGGDLEEDGLYFNGTEVVSSGTGIRYRSGATTWTTVGLSLDASYPTAMAMFDGANGLMVGNKNVVKLVGTGWTVTVTLTLPDAYYVTSVCANGNTGYVATRHIANGEARMFPWDGVSTGAINSYPVGSFETFTVKPSGSSVVCVTAAGQILRFNGGGFDPVGQLPPYNRQEEWADASNDYSRVSNRGFAFDGNVAYLAVSSEYDAMFRYRADFPGGLWCVDPSHGVYHKHGPSRTTFRAEADVATSSVNTTTNVITVTAAPETGDQVVYLSGGDAPIGGLRDQTRYYAIKVSSTTFKLATTYANAQAATAIDLTSTGNASQDFLIYAVRDYGWSLVPTRSSVAVLNGALVDTAAGRYAMTSTLYSTSAGNRVNATVWNVPALLCDNRGYVVYPRLNSYEVTDGYVAVALKHRPLADGEKIVVKYRAAERAMPSEIPDGQVAYTRGVWSDANTFTTLRDLSAVAEGDEVEIVSGSGAGCLAHVSSISESSGTYTVNLDENIPGVTAADDMDFVVDNWTKVATLESSTTSSEMTVDYSKGYAVFPVAADGKFIQLKVEMRGRGRFIEEVQVGNQTLLPLLRQPQVV